MRIRSKFLLLFGIVAAVNVIGGFIVALHFGKIEGHMEQIQLSASLEANHAREMYERFVVLSDDLDLRVVHFEENHHPHPNAVGVTNHVNRLRQAYAGLFRATQLGLQLSRSRNESEVFKREQAKLVRLEQLGDRLEAAFDEIEVLTAANQGDPEKVHALWHDRLDGRLEKLTEISRELYHETFAELTGEMNEISLTLQEAQRTIFSSIVAAVLCALGVATYTTFNIARPLRMLNRAVVDVGEGRLGDTVHLKRNDELGKLSDSFNHMSHSLRDSESALRDAVGDLERKNEELQQFVHTVSHDLKSPLITLTGFLGALEHDLETDPNAARDDVRRMGRAASHMAKLLDSLIELSRIGMVCQPPERVSVAAAVDEVRENLAILLRERGVTVELQEPLPAVSADPVRLGEALQNLVENAAKYMGDQPHPHIKIGCRDPEADWPTIFVADNGIGLDSVHREKVFNLFHKVDRRVEGMGVGLALVRRIIEFQGGRIWAESAGEGAGTTFCFTLPAAEEDEPGTKTDAVSSGSLASSGASDSLSAPPTKDA